MLRNPKFVEIGALRQELYTFYSCRRCYIALRIKQYRAVTVAAEVKMLRERVTVLHYTNIGLLWVFNLLKPNDIYICRNAALTSRRYILNIYSTYIRTEYFKHAA